MLKQHLMQAEEQLARGEQNLAHQRKIVQELQCASDGTSQAEEPLALLKRAQAIYIADRDWLRKELEALCWPDSSGTGWLMNTRNERLPSTAAPRFRD